MSPQQGKGRGAGGAERHTCPACPCALTPGRPGCEVGQLLGAEPWWGLESGPGCRDWPRATGSGGAPGPGSRDPPRGWNRQGRGRDECPPARMVGGREVGRGEQSNRVGMCVQLHTFEKRLGAWPYSSKITCLQRTFTHTTARKLTSQLFLWEQMLNSLSNEHHRFNNIFKHTPPCRCVNGRGYWWALIAWAASPGPTPHPAPGPRAAWHSYCLSQAAGLQPSCSHACAWPSVNLCNLVFCKRHNRSRYNKFNITF